MAKNFNVNQQFIKGVQKRKEEALLNKSEDKIKLDEMQQKLVASRRHGTEQNKRIKELEKQVKYLQSEIKNLKADNENLKEDLKNISSTVQLK